MFCGRETNTSTEEADALRAAFNHGDSIGNLLYIGRKHDFTGVKRDGWCIPDLGQFVLQIFLLFFQLTILKEGLVRGIDDEYAIEVIKQHVITGGHVFAGALRPTTAGIRREPAIMAV